MKVWFKSISFLIAVLCLCFVLDIVIGSVWIPIEEVLAVIIGKSDHVVWTKIIVNYRLPRAIAALLAGAALSLSGLLMQTFFRNPLAGPFVLGISSGASLGVAVVVFGSSLLGLGFLELSGVSWAFGAIIGSFLVFMVVIFFSALVKDNTSLLIIGLMFSSATSAVVSVLQYFSNPEDIQSYLMWTFGDLGSVTVTELYVLAPIVIMSLFASIFLVKPLNIYMIGFSYAKNAGLNIIFSKYAIITVTALSAGVVTAYCGPIAFVGLATPHIARMILDTSDHKKLIPYSVLTGAIVLLVCDMISRLPGLPQSLPLNAITSLFGGPLVIYLIVKRKNIQSAF